MPILDAMLPSNRLQVEAARVKIHESGAKRIGILGLSFKAGTDDLRESPMISLVRELWQDGLEVMIYDPDVNPEILLGSNLYYLKRQLPQIDEILRSDLKEVLNTCQTIVICQKRPEFTTALQELDSSTAVIDLVRLSKGACLPGIVKYEGISWNKNGATQLSPTSFDIAAAHTKIAAAVSQLQHSTTTDVNTAANALQVSKNGAAHATY